MRDGIYTVDSIEKGIAKVLYRPNEEIEELIQVSEFPFAVSEGDIIEIKTFEDNTKLTYRKKDTEDTKAYVKSLREKLLYKNKE